MPETPKVRLKPNSCCPLKAIVTQRRSTLQSDIMFGIISPGPTLDIRQDERSVEMGRKTILAIVAFFLVFSCACSKKPSGLATDNKTGARLEADGGLSFPGITGSLRNGFSAAPLPAPLLDALAKSIDFAYEQKSAREISDKDLDHAHVLFKKDLPPAQNDKLQSFDGILLHTQEFVSYSPELYKKRNILFDRATQQLSIVPCSKGVFVKYLFQSLARKNNWAISSQNKICTVYSNDLGMSGVQVNFVVVDQTPISFLKNHYRNIRTIRGKKVLFSTSDYFWDDGPSTLSR